MTNTKPDRPEHWRWFADITWHYFCSMQYEAACAKEANNDFMRYHHLRSCIYFAIGTLESFLNAEMRRFKERQKENEDEVIKLLRNKTLDAKINNWPTEICGKEIKLPNEILKVLGTHKIIRNEVTHPKLRDHSIYIDLDNVDSNILVDAVARSLVIMFDGMNRAFPYWVLGWNYVGLNGNPAHPLLSNNMNGFIWSIKSMGISGNGLQFHDLDWDKKHMRTLHDYEALKDILDQYPYDIEPYYADFPLKPRLTRKWWDTSVVKVEKE